MFLLYLIQDVLVCDQLTCGVLTVTADFGWNVLDTASEILNNWQRVYNWFQMLLPWSSLTLLFAWNSQKQLLSQRKPEFAVDLLHSP